MSTKPKTGDHVGRGVLRSQKQARSKKAKSQTMPAPTPRPTTQATVTLASGERWTTEIEATNDKEWNDLAALAEGGGDLSLDQKDITHQTIAAIVALRHAHDGDEWKPYCLRRGMKWPKEVKSPFRVQSQNGKPTPRVGPDHLLRDNLEGSVGSRDSKGRCRGAARDTIEAGLN
jgi:hypothetical protein